MAVTSWAARAERAAGALIGAVVGDALGAPFEFGPPGAFSRRFPERVLLDPGEMVGGGAWEPAEWTDDTQMALLMAESLLDRGGIDEAHVFGRFSDWYRASPKDVGISTRAVLGSRLPWTEAAGDHYRRTAKAAGNGSLMRTVPAALFFAGAGRDATVDAARRLSDLTHGDPAAGDGCAMYHELIRIALDGDDPLAALDDVLSIVPADRRERWVDRLGPSYDPAADPIPNGAVWPSLATAVWALRTTTSFEDALRAAADVGNDTDTVACITGGLAGAVHSVGAIPSRWTTYLHGSVVGHDDSGIGVDELHTLARSLLAGGPVAPPGPVHDHTVEPVLVGADAGVYAASWFGVSAAAAGGRLPSGAMVVSLSRTFGELQGHRPRRAVYMVDQDGDDRNLALVDALDDTIATMAAAVDARVPVVVHCHGGRSRTGLVLRAWLLARDPSLSVERSAAELRTVWPHLDEWNARFTSALGEWTARVRPAAGPS